MSRNVIWVISSQEYDDKDWRTNTYRSTTLSGPPAPGRLQMVVARPSNIKYNLHYDKRSSTNSSTQSDSIKVVETHRSHSITATIGRQGSSRGASAARAHDHTFFVANIAYDANWTVADSNDDIFNNLTSFYI